MHDRVGTFAGLGDLGRNTDSPFNNASLSGDHQDQAVDGQAGQFSGLGQQLGQLDLGSQSLGQSQVLGSSASNQPPAPQQRTMVMPDRMRWIYRDPQGQTQGPWSGLEMHDWYKAGFFSPELLVKKYEDQDYEPLAQLIRRIGNSREPFLVPQIGIPHGPPSGSGPNAWAGTGSLASNGAAAIGGAQPPFASSFPSFGTTLTADQQNALERRKQEEQYLMARQKEHLAQAQMSQRFQMQGVGHPGLLPGQLHHHSSAHSLHSQQSFGSITGPGTGYQQGPPAAAHQPGFFDNSFRAPQPIGAGAIGSGIDALGQIREEDPSGLLGRSSLIGNRAGPGQFGAPGQPAIGQQPSQIGGKEQHEGRVQQMMQDRARLEQEQAEYDAQHEDDEEEDDETNNRLEQFQQLQSQDEPAPVGAGKRNAQAQQAQAESLASQSSISSPVNEAAQAKERFSRDAAIKPNEPGLPQPFPAPATTKMPLAAPEPQRPGRPIVADHLQQNSRDHSETPSAEAKVAPWANREAAEGTKGPSLKEIQEMEAKQAAKAEEIAAAARRAALQKAMELEAQAAVVQPGLPTTSNWATGSPATPTGSGPAAWAKTAPKAAGPAPAKSMAQIQKEEEARKRKLAAAAAMAQASSMANVSAPAGAKSYANLAGKVGAPSPGPAVGGAWTTVGASGKVKTPLPAAPATGNRAVSASVLPTIQNAAASVRKVPSRSSTLVSSGAINAQDEFKKWAANELRPDLSKGILGKLIFNHPSHSLASLHFPFPYFNDADLFLFHTAEDFVSSLTMLPAEADIITEAVHGASSTLDSRHFAEEFLRRKKLADKGLVDAAPLKSASPHHAAGDGKAGGWNEVAKKGPLGGGKDAAGAGGGKDDPVSAAAAAAGGTGMFRVVPAKKKGGKR
jgi:PERQ amino acid-rich with GYF domain-containing protein